MVSKEQFGWLAGIIDGEGCLTITKRYTKTGSGRGHVLVGGNRIAVANTSPTLIYEVVRIYQDMGVKYSLGFRSQANHTVTPIRQYKRYCQLIVVDRVSILKVLEAISPYLILKKRQAEVLREYCQTTLDHKISAGERMSMIERIQFLNRGESFSVETECPAPKVRVKSQSELHGDMQSEAEMPSPVQIAKMLEKHSLQ